MRAVVVGGGIGGLAAAVALHRAGWGVEVLERRAALSEVGAGISLFPNALTALDRLGVWPDIRDAAATEVGGVRRPDGRWLTRLDTDAPPPVEILLVHRRELHERLRAALPEGIVLAGSPVTGVDADGGVTLDGRTERADLVVAADGIDSTVRRALWPERAGAVYAGFTAWRGVTDQPFDLAAGAGTWGRGAEFGATHMIDGRVYWYGTANRPVGERADGGRAGAEHVEVLRRFGDWHAPIGDILRATAPDAVLRHDIHALPAPLGAFHRGRVALLGDAAHAMTPNLGQGGCQALEDAVTLAAVLRGSEHDVASALARYDALRRPRTEHFVRTSARAARMYQTENRLAVAARDLATRVVPPRLAAAGLRRMIAWTPPD